MKENAILVLIHQKLTGVLNQEGEKRLNEWLRQSQDNQNYFEEIKKSWELSLLASTGFKPDAQAAYSKFRKRLETNQISGSKPQNSNIRPLSLLFKVAAVLLVAAGVGYLLNPYLNSSASAYNFKTSENESLVIHLKDGSMVWLEANSELIIDKKFNTTNRNITFKGTGLFDVASNPDLPFQIDGGKAEVNVLGTKFIFNTGNSQFSGSVKVLEGKVRFTLEGTNQSLVLTAKQAGTLARDNTVQKVPFDEPVFKATDKLIFKEVPLNQALDVLERQYNVELVWSDQNNPLKCLLISDYENASLQNVFKSLEIIFGLSFQQTGENTYTLIGGSCH